MISIIPIVNIDLLHSLLFESITSIPHMSMVERNPQHLHNIYLSESKSEYPTKFKSPWAPQAPHQYTPPSPNSSLSSTWSSRLLPRLFQSLSLAHHAYSCPLITFQYWDPPSVGPQIRALYTEEGSSRLPPQMSSIQVHLRFKFPILSTRFWHDDGNARALQRQVQGLQQ